MFYEQLHWLFQIVCVISCASRLPLAADDEPLSNTDVVVLKIQEAFVCVRVFVYIIYICMYICRMHINMCVYIYIYVDVKDIHTYIHTNMYICLYIYIYIYTHTHMCV